MSDSDSDASMPGLVSNSESEDDSSDDDRPDEPAEYLSQDAEDPDEARPEGPTGVVEGLESRPELNGVRVELLDFNPDRGRWVVREVGDGWRRRGEAAPWGVGSATSVARTKVRIDDGPSLDRADMMRERAEIGAREAAASREAREEREVAELPFAEPEPEPEETAADAAAEAEREAERKRRKAERKKEQQRRARERKRLEQQALDKENAEGQISPTIPDLAPGERMERAEKLTNVALADWTTEQAAEWASLIEFDAPKEVCTARLQLLLEAFQEGIDGCELRTMSEKRLSRMLDRAPKRAESADGTVSIHTQSAVACDFLGAV